ncbi:MAG: endonuclease/exonuclease/phosphatase family protein [Salinivirgaceae bacterium]|jgi:endonuclease/exonuclease/phosphatase family metal-dependent hydrolase|nr:endonuclease/exonuclease/phosphatase family protein [Salinivirgaceae bacterium]
MKIIDFQVGVLVFLISCVHVVTGQNIDLKIMSFNIQQPYGNNWEERRDSVVAIINIENPDIVGTQEAINSQRNYLIDSTRNYNWYGLGRDGGDNGEGSWIFYKKDKYIIDSANSGNFWLSDTPNVPSRFGGDYNRICTFVRLIDTATHQGFYLFNAHFPTPDIYAARLKSIKLMAQYMAERALLNEPILATGDFNSSENDGVTKWMKTGNDNPIQCRDSYRDKYPDGTVNTGFGTKFDYIYYENHDNYITQDSWVVNNPSDASDHMPIVAEISIIYAVEGNLLPIANAGSDLVITDVNNGGNAIVQLDASASFDTDGIIDTYIWKLADTVLAEGINPTVNLTVGNHVIYLTVVFNAKSWQEMPTRIWHICKLQLTG